MQLDGMWNYAPMQFDDFSILYICQECDSGERVLEEAVRLWQDPDREPEWLGRPEHEHVFRSGTRVIERFEIGSQVGYGLHEYGFFGPFARYGLEGFNEGAA